MLLEALYTSAGSVAGLTMSSLIIVSAYFHYKVSSDTIIGQGATLNFKLVRMKLFQSVPELSGTYRSSFDVKSISGMTS